MAKIINDGNIIRVPYDRQLPYRKGIGEVIFEKLNENTNSPLQIDGITGEIDTYGSVLERSIRTALKMRSKGITREDIITVCSYNHLNTSIPILGSFLLGVKTESIDPSLSLSDSTYLLKQVRPKMIFVSPNGIELIENVIRKIGINPEIIVFGKSDKYTEFFEFLTESPKEEKAFVPVKINHLKETAFIYFSSGTTGLPKGVCLNHLSALSQITTLSQVRKPISSGSTISLNYSGPYWISYVIVLLNTIANNNCRLVLPNFEINTLWHSIDKYKITTLVLSPAQLATVCNSKKPKNINASTLMLILVGGSTVYKEQTDQMKELFPNTIVATGYGQTELGGSCLQFDLMSEEINYLIEKPLSCGRPVPGYTYKVVDLDTERPLGPNQKGELRVKTEFCMNGYYNADAIDAWDSEGFLKTGDIVYYDEDFCFFIVERIKDMLKYQSWQIAPAILESILLSHPAVEVALVIGLPHPIDGDHPTAVVQLKRSAINVTSEDIQKYYDEKIEDDRHKLRGGLKIVDDIPVTPTGKYRKKYLKDLILAGSL